MSKAKNIHEIKIEIKGDEWKESLDKAFKKVIKEVKIDGFRVGKAPRDIYEKKYGVQYLVSTAVEDEMDDAFKKALKKFKGTPIIRPSVSIEKADTNGVIYVFTFTTMPEVKINKYKSLGVKEPSYKVTQKEVDEEIEKLKKEYADLQIKDGKIENGDTAVIDFEGFDGDKPFAGGKGENYSLEIGSGTFIPGFEEKLIGLKAGDKKDIKVKFPDDYHAEELKGKPATFKVTIHEVKTKVYPELNEDFFADLGYDDVKTVDELKTKLKEVLKEQKEYTLKNKYMDDLFDALLKEVTVDIPHEMIHEEIDNMIEQYEERLKMQGITLEQFYKYSNTTEESLRSQMHGEAEKRIKLRFALDEIIKLENIDATDEEVNKDAEEKAKKYNMNKDDYIKEFGGIDMIKYDVKISKVIELLK